MTTRDDLAKSIHLRADRNLTACGGVEGESTRMFDNVLGYTERKRVTCEGCKRALTTVGDQPYGRADNYDFVHGFLAGYAWGRFFALDDVGRWSYFGEHEEDCFCPVCTSGKRVMRQAVEALIDHAEWECVSCGHKEYHLAQARVLPFCPACRTGAFIRGEVYRAKGGLNLSDSEFADNILREDLKRRGWDPGAE